jgi:hypothetical protein
VERSGGGGQGRIGKEAEMLERAAAVSRMT